MRNNFYVMCLDNFFEYLLDIKIMNITMYYYTLFFNLALYMLLNVILKIKISH